MILLNTFTTPELILIGSMIWGLFVLSLFLRFAFDPNFSKKLPIYLRRINVRKFIFLTLKIIGVVSLFLSLFYLAGGVNFDQTIIISALILVSGAMVILMMGVIMNVSERVTLPELTPQQVRKEKLKKIHRKRFIYRIKNIF